MAKSTDEQQQVRDPRANMPLDTFELEFLNYLRSGYQSLLVCTTEEARAEASITRVADSLGRPVITWDFATGFSIDSLRNQTAYKQPPKALEALTLENLPREAVFVFRDLDDFWNDPMVMRRIRNLTEFSQLVNEKWLRPMIVLTPNSDIPFKLRATTTLLDFDLPNEQWRTKTFEFVQSSIAVNKPDAAAVDQDLLEKIVGVTAGLTDHEAENALSRAAVVHKGLSAAILPTLIAEKAAAVRKSEVLTFIPETTIPDRDQIGGYDNYLEWLDLQAMAYSRDAHEKGIDKPKGVVLLGAPGTGKSMVGKATCKVLGLPGYILDVGAVFGSLVGESEARMRRAIRQVDAQNGCVLVVDEADKALGNAHDSQGDSGVTKRVFGTFLNWLAEKQTRTFVIMTLNRTNNLPPELMRAGRFDARFYTDLPDEEMRRTIFDIHFNKRKGTSVSELGFTDGDWQAIIDATSDFVGSEIEQVVVESRLRRYKRDRNVVPTFDDVIAAAGNIVPMAKNDPGGIEQIRQFCVGNATPVAKIRRKSKKRLARGMELN